MIREFGQLKTSRKIRTVSNKPCHPNPTALVGNLLTGEGNVVEVVETR